VGTDVSRGVERQKTCGSLGQNLQTLTIKQQAKDVFNLTVYIKYYLASLFSSSSSSTTVGSMPVGV